MGAKELVVILAVLLDSGCCQERIIYHDMNNMVGINPKPGMNVGNMVFLGYWYELENCINDCISYPHGRCLTFTFYTEEHDGPIKGGCIAGIEDPYWSPINEQNVVSGQIIWPCRSDTDCSLNGRCASNGKCICRKAWTGPRCDQLNLLPADRNSGYHYMEDGRNISSWGGAVLRGNDGKYHMIAAEMTEHCGINSWTLNSQVIHASSDTPAGTYKRQEVIRKPFAHEPDAVKGPNGEFVMYWSEYHHDMPLCNCSDGSTPPSCKRPDRKFHCYMSYTLNPDSPWSEPVQIPTPSPRGLAEDNNFAMVILKNGSLIGFTRWGARGGSRIHLATASNWKDPSSYQVHEELFVFLPPVATEDPFLYLDEDGHFHAIFHNMAPNDVQDNCGGHAYSLDGENWVYGGKAFSNHVVFTDGGSFTFTRRERPHLVFAEDGVTPIALTNGAQYGGQYGDATYTLLQPIAN